MIITPPFQQQQKVGQSTYVVLSEVDDVFMAFWKLLASTKLIIGRCIHKVLSHLIFPPIPIQQLNSVV